jgi:general secretion pathway protein G
MWPRRWRVRAHDGGFTFIELVVTVAIVAVLASVALPLASLSVQRVKESELRRGLREIRSAIDAYKRAFDEGRILARGVVDSKRPDGARIYFLRRLPRDPFFPDPDTTPERSWGLRSYASLPEAPAPGADVFDVYSLAPGVGLNGIPYRDW